MMDTQWLATACDEHGRKMQTSHCLTTAEAAAYALIAWHAVADRCQVWEATRGSDGLMHLFSPRKPQLWERDVATGGVRRVA